MDVMVTVDETGRAADGAFESLELPVDLVGHFGPVDPAGGCLADQLAQPWEPAAGG